MLNERTNNFLAFDDYKQAAVTVTPNFQYGFGLINCSFLRILHQGWYEIGDDQVWRQQPAFM